MSQPILELPGLWVSVDSVEFNPTTPTTPQQPYAFVYHITIHNDSTRTITIKGRKWIIASASGEKAVIEGDGVIGEFPCLAAGESFQYHSYHLIKNNSAASGAYFGQDFEGQRVVVRIPPFEMVVPLV